MNGSSAHLVSQLEMIKTSVAPSIALHDGCHDDEFPEYLFAGQFNIIDSADDILKVIIG